MHKNYGVEVLAAYQSIMKKNSVFALKSNLTAAEISLLMLVFNCNELSNSPTVTTIANKLDISKSAISQTVSKLEKKNYIVRRAKEEDKKQQLLCLTDEAVEIIHLQKLNIVQKINQIAQYMGEKQMDHFVNLVQKFDEALKKIESMEG